jgi:NAD(P)H dehydrogenase (quinone)
MKANIVFAHAGKDSFSHQILHRVSHTLDDLNISYTVRDLYNMNFQPVFGPDDMRLVEQGKVSQDIEEEQILVTEADTLIMIYPVWWWSQPAILKGWIDRVFTLNYAFRYTPDGPVGLLTGKRAFVFTTTRESAEEMRKKGLDVVIERQVKEGILAFSGFSPVTFINFAEVPDMSDDAKENVLLQVEQSIRSVREAVSV